MEESFQQALLRKHHHLSDEELQALLEQHRRDKARLMERKAADRSGHEDKLKQKLAERNKKMLKKTGKVLYFNIFYLK